MKLIQTKSKNGFISPELFFQLPVIKTKSQPTGLLYDLYRHSPFTRFLDIVIFAGKLNQNVKIAWALLYRYNQHINPLNTFMDPDKTKDFETFYQQFVTRNYKKGEMLIRADDDPQGIFCLTKGYVRQYTISPAGNELSLHILKPISYFPMVWAVNGTPNVYFFEALTAVEVGRAPREQVVNFIKDKPALLFALMSELLEDYAETLKRVEHLVFSDAYRRVISVLIYITKHFGQPYKKGIIVNHRFTQADIATLVGVARETASIELIKLEKKGLVRYVDHSMLFDNIKELNSELFSSPKS